MYIRTLKQALNHRVIYKNVHRITKLDSMVEIIYWLWIRNEKKKEKMILKKKNANEHCILCKNNGKF